MHPHPPRAVPGENPAGYGGPGPGGRYHGDAPWVPRLSAVSVRQRSGSLLALELVKRVGKGLSTRPHPEGQPALDREEGEGTQTE